MGSGASKPVEPTKVAEVVVSPKATPAPESQQNSSSSSGGCPMKKTDGSYSYDWGALFRKDFPHGPGGLTPIPEQQQQTGNGCPVQQRPEASSGCPVKHGQEYNVYSQPIDPKNNMPKVANQLPAPSQTKPLSTHRVSSTIPKGGTSDESTTWTYPSPQMFYNALARKGKLASTAKTEEDEQDMMESVVAMHNAMNEKSWQKVLQWEAATNPQEKSARLLKFQGRPSDLSPKAWFKHYLLGHPLPFDRHDWTVVRQDGTTARYVLDYYYDDSPNEEETAKKSLLVDVRPALDSPVSLWHRCATMPTARHLSNSTDFEPLPLRPTHDMQTQVQESVKVWRNIQADVAATRGQGNGSSETTSKQDMDLTEAKAKELSKVFDKAWTDCQEVRNALDACESELECAQASMSFTMCMAQLACPLQHKTLVEALQNDDDNAIDPALERVSNCVALQTQLHEGAKQKYPHIFKS